MVRAMPEFTVKFAMTRYGPPAAVQDVLEVIAPLTLATVASSIPHIVSRATDLVAVGVEGLHYHAVDTGVERDGVVRPSCLPR